MKTISTDTNNIKDRFKEYLAGMPKKVSALRLEVNNNTFLVVFEEPLPELPSFEEDDEVPEPKLKNLFEKTPKKKKPSKKKPSKKENDDDWEIDDDDEDYEEY